MLSAGANGGGGTGAGTGRFGSSVPGAIPGTPASFTTSAGGGADGRSGGGIDDGRALAIRDVRSGYERRAFSRLISWSVRRSGATASSTAIRTSARTSSRTSGGSLSMPGVALAAAPARLTGSPETLAPIIAARGAMAGVFGVFPPAEGGVGENGDTPVRAVVRGAAGFFAESSATEALGCSDSKANATSRRQDARSSLRMR